MPSGRSRKAKWRSAASPNGQQLDPDARRVGVRGHREVRPGEARGGADRRQEVLDERQVEHLLRADLEQRLAPALDRDELLRRQALADVLLERERGEQVLEHDQVLELRGLAERVDQRLAVLEATGVRVTRPPADLQHAGQRPVRDGAGWSVIGARVLPGSPHRRDLGRPTGPGSRGGRPGSTTASPRRAGRTGSSGGPSRGSAPSRAGSGSGCSSRSARRSGTDAGGPRCRRSRGRRSRRRAADRPGGRARSGRSAA